MISNVNTERNAQQKMKVMVGSNQVTLLLNSGSVCSTVTKDLRVPIIELQRGKIGNGKEIKNKELFKRGTLMAPVDLNNWTTKNVHFLIAVKELRPVVVRNLFETFGIYIIPQKATNRIVYCVNTPNQIKQ